MSNTEMEEPPKVVAYLHHKNDNCVTTDPTAYDKPRKLVIYEDVMDRIEWLEKGNDEWRTYAIETGRQLAAARKEIERLKAEVKPAKGSTPGFDAFWAAWPQSSRKVNKKGCLTRWVAAKLEEDAARIIEHVELMKLGRDWTKDAGMYIPAPLVYLNQERYLAPPSPPAAAAKSGHSFSNTNYHAGVNEDGTFD